MKVGYGKIVKRCMSFSCPNCGYRPIFKNAMRACSECHRCGLLFSRRYGFYLGAMCFNYALSILGLLPVVLWLFLGKIVSLWLIIVIGVLLSGVLPIVFYKLSWMLWLWVYYMMLPGELNGKEEYIERSNVENES